MFLNQKFSATVYVFQFSSGAHGELSPPGANSMWRFLDLSAAEDLGHLARHSVGASRILIIYASDTLTRQ
jgi:hypothetical protein